MIFISKSTFLGCDELTVPCTPTNVDNLIQVDMYSARIDTLYATKNTDYNYSENIIPSEWDFDTIMLADYLNDTSAGNVNWHLKDLRYIIMKIKNKEDHKWITSYVKKVDNYEDLFIAGKYLAATTGIWDVALVPISLEGDEGTYVKTDIDVEINKLVILDNVAIHSTFLTDGSLSTQSVMPNQVVETLHSKFPYIVRNTVANYETVNVSAVFLPDEKDACNFDDVNSYKNSARWNREIKGWIMNGKTKLLKNIDGDMWLGFITTPVSDEPYEDGVYEYRKLSFGLTETGLANSEKNLWDAGLIDESVTSDWWN